MKNVNVLIGLGAIGFSCLLMFVWIPLDITSGAFLKARGQHLIGDSFAPLVAGVMIALSGVMLAVFERKKPNQETFTLAELCFVGSLIAVLVFALLMMTYGGPIMLGIADWVTGQEREYRLLRDEMPWKYSGYLLGGTFMMAGIMACLHRRLSARFVIVGIISTLLIAALFDLPFDDLLLPPNGDV